MKQVPKPVASDATVDKVAESVNAIIDYLSQTVDKRLLIGENVRGSFVNVSATSAELPLKFTNPLQTVPDAVILCGVKVNGEFAASGITIDWRPDGSTLAITALNGATAGVRYSLRLLVL